MQPPPGAIQNRTRSWQEHDPAPTQSNARPPPAEKWRAGCHGPAPGPKRALPSPLAEKVFPSLPNGSANNPAKPSQRPTLLLHPAVALRTAQSDSGTEMHGPPNTPPVEAQRRIGCPHLPAPLAPSHGDAPQSLGTRTAKQVPALPSVKTIAPSNPPP